MALAIDVNSNKTAAVNTAGGSGTITTNSFSTTSANELLLALVASNSTTGATGGTVTASVSGAGLTWTLVVRSNTKDGTAEVWYAYATSVLSSVSVTATITTANGKGASGGTLLNVISFTGVDTTSGNGSSAIGASNTGNGSGTGSKPSVNVTTTRNNSWVFGVGNDWDNNVTVAVGTGQTLINTYADSSDGDTTWTQRQTSTTSTSGTVVTTNDTVPSGDQWNMAVVEILPPSAGGNNYTQNLSDSLTLADSFTFSLSRAWTDSFSLADSIAKAPAKKLGDSFSFADSIVRTTGKALADSITLADSAARSVGKSLADAFTLAESIAKSTARTLTDAFSLSDAYSSIKVKVLSFLDSFSLTDSLAKQTGKGLTDNVSLSEHLAKLVTKAPFLDTVTLADAFSALKTKILQFADAFTLSDSIAKVTAKSFRETFSISDTFAAAKTKFLQFVDSISLIDRGLTKMTGKALSEAFALSDGMAKAISKGFADALTLADSIATALIGAADAVRLYFAQLWQRLWGAQAKTRLWSATEKMIYSDPKDAEATEDFEIDWSGVIGADTISSSTWEVPSGLTLVQYSNTPTTATARLSGGTAGQSYVVKNLVTLASGQVKPQALLLPVV